MKRYFFLGEVLMFRIMSSLIFLFSSCLHRHTGTAVEDNSSPDQVKQAQYGKGNFKLFTYNQSGCNYLGTSIPDNIKLYPPTQKEIDAVNHILQFTGIPLGFDIYGSDINNAVATIVESQRYIIYDRNLFNDVADHSYWISISILAHEIGHHLAGHTLIPGKKLMQEELDADRFSGFILYKMGAPVEEATKAIKSMSNLPRSKTHPGKKERIEAITAGWLEANKLRFEDATPPPPMDLGPEEVRSGLTEFQTEIFEDEKTYDEILKQSGNGFYISPVWDGIVLNSDPDEEYWWVNVLVTGKAPGNLNPEYSVLNERMDIEVANYNNTNGVKQRKRLSQILVPGRKIRFAYMEAGSGRFKNFVYIKYLPVLPKQSKENE